MNIGELFETGTVCGVGFLEQSADNGFIPHSAFKGVSLKHLVRGEMTGGQISCHLVRVEPGCVLDTHTHPAQIEIHEVIYGDGVCELSGDKFDYKPGVVGVIPSGAVHRIVAGKEGLYILAKFTPSLL